MVDSLSSFLYGIEDKPYDVFEEGEKEQLTMFADVLSVGDVKLEVVVDIQCIKYKKSFWCVPPSIFFKP